MKLQGVTILPGGKALEARWDDGSSGRFHAI